ncbi:MAG: FAD-dependent monooxygenase [Bacteroidales bacterium]|nr:FAD-dependent monooxygenase [Bacteroidales bacterium]
MPDTEPIFVELKILPQDAGNSVSIQKALSRKTGLSESEVRHFRILRRSIDARKKPVRINLRIELRGDNQENDPLLQSFKHRKVDNGQEVLVVGAGPAGLFASLRLIESGLKPIILERGKDVSERKKDIAAINRNTGVNPESNYCFGEGGAGAFSDGKLYTRSKKRGETRRVLEILVQFGADPDILIDARPHIGSDKLPAILVNIRQAIIECGGVFKFNSRLDAIETSATRLVGVSTNDGDRYKDLPVILATGHSARDIYHLLSEQKILIEAKGFAMGVRVEHPQSLIDQIQYHSQQGRGDYLPPAEYNLTAQFDNRGVYSFCMCPGGTIVPSITADNELVVNGMSNSVRGSEWANSGIVVELQVSDYQQTHGDSALAGLSFQEELEKMAYLNGGHGLIAPAQRISDFVQGRVSSDLPKSSYNPGLLSTPLHFWLPEGIRTRLKRAFLNFNRRMSGFVSREGIVVGVESRTSSPVRIPRDHGSMEHVEIEGLFPCGEGAGYSGGIVSSAIDGLLSAEGVIKKYVV